jgi:hypothetical protein
MFADQEMDESEMDFNCSPQEAALVVLRRDDIVMNITATSSP